MVFGRCRTIEGNGLSSILSEYLKPATVSADLFSVSEKPRVQVSYHKVDIISTAFAVKMSSTNPNQTPSPSNTGTPETPGGSGNEGLHIPISHEGGFYGYPEERHLLHVTTPAHALLPSPQTNSSAQIGEKMIVQRRGSTTSDGAKSAFKSGLAMTSVASVIEPNISIIASSPFFKEEDVKSEPSDAGPNLHPGLG